MQLCYFGEFETFLSRKSIVVVLSWFLSNLEWSHFCSCKVVFSSGRYQAVVRQLSRRIRFFFEQKLAFEIWIDGMKSTTVGFDECICFQESHKIHLGSSIIGSPFHLIPEQENNQKYPAIIVELSVQFFPLFVWPAMKKNCLKN